MPLTVGTNAYDTVENADSYHEERGNTDWAAAAADDKAVYLIKATDWLERNFRWRGTKQVSSQRLGWPRDDAYDDDDYQIGTSEAPWQVKEAMFMVADLVREGTVDLEGVLLDSNTGIKREKVDVIEVEYDTAHRLRGQSVLSHIHLLLKSVTLSDMLLRA